MRAGLTATVLALAAAAFGCHRSGVGGDCNDASDCQSGLICSPNGTCVDPSTDGGGPGTDAAGPGTDATGPGTDATGPGTDATGPGTDSTTMTGTDAAPGTDAGPGTVTFCGAGAACAGGETCQMSLCGAGEGFCTAGSRPFCGGMIAPPAMCPATGFTSCLGQGPCVADAGGICVTPAERTMICAMQPTLWGCP